MPRGLLHEGKASDAMSFHMTIGIHAYTWSQLIKDVLSEMEHVDINVRRSVAPQLASIDEQDKRVGDIATALSNRLLDLECIRRAANQKVEAVQQRTQRSFRGRFTEILRSGDISAATIVQIRSRTDVQIEESGSKVTLKFSGKSLTLPGFTKPHLRALCNGVPISARDLPSNLEDDGKLVLIRRLVDEGLLQVLRL
jgi:hypothetical protein